MKIINLLVPVLIVSIGFYIYKDLQKPILKSAVINTVPTPFYSPTPSKLDAVKLWKIVNDYRLSKNLQPFTKNDELCRIAIERAPEIVKEIDTPHKGFHERYDSYPYKMGENATGAIGEKDALNRWLNSPPHKSALDGSWLYSCIACDKDIACVQIFSSFDDVNHNAL